MRNSWEDKFFSMLMLDNNGDQAAAAADAANLSPTPINEAGPVTVSQQSMDMQGVTSKKDERLDDLPESDDLSDVSSPDLS
jgi:hypothetical protein